MHELLANRAVDRILIGTERILSVVLADWRFTTELGGNRRTRRSQPEMEVRLGDVALAGKGEEREEGEEKARIRHARDARTCVPPPAFGLPRHCRPRNGDEKNRR